VAQGGIKAVLHHCPLAGRPLPAAQACQADGGGALKEAGIGGVALGTELCGPQLKNGARHSLVPLVLRRAAAVGQLAPGRLQQKRCERTAAVELPVFCGIFVVVAKGWGLG
jgi:hypothetical protein